MCHSAIEGPKTFLVSISYVQNVFSWVFRGSKIFSCFHRILGLRFLKLNLRSCFQKSPAFETGLSVFHRLMVTVIKSNIPEQQVKIIKHRNYTKAVTLIFSRIFFAMLKQTWLNNKEITTWQTTRILLLKN